MFRNMLEDRTEADRAPNISIKYEIFIRTTYPQRKALIQLINTMNKFLHIHKISTWV